MKKSTIRLQAEAAMLGCGVKQHDLKIVYVDTHKRSKRVKFCFTTASVEQLASIKAVVSHLNPGHDVQVWNHNHRPNGLAGYNMRVGYYGLCVKIFNK